VCTGLSVESGVGLCFVFEEAALVRWKICSGVIEHLGNNGYIESVEYCSRKFAQMFHTELFKYWIMKNGWGGGRQ